MEHLIMFPDPQPTAPAAVAYHVGGEFVRGDNKVVGAPPR
jgi:hypothetical protein